MSSTAIVWFRNDLRLHDNEALSEALQKHDFVIPVYVFDERVFLGKTRFGFEKSGVYRTKFIIESVLDLQQQLRSKSADLFVFTGNPGDVIFQLAKDWDAQSVYCNRERTQEEVDVQESLERKLWTLGKELHYTRGKMLVYTSDLPFPVSQVPDVFTQYRKEIEASTSVRSPLPSPSHISLPPGIEIGGEVPTLQQFGKVLSDHLPLENLKFTGGETAGLSQLQYYLWDSDLIRTYKETRNGLMGWEYSSKFSPWLAVGCLSPKQIYKELKHYEAERGGNSSTYWLYFELLWRDYFRLMGKKYGNKIFQNKGLRQKDSVSAINWNAFEKWRKGETGAPLVDACMRQLNTTGFMSNRGRQNVASYLVHQLRVNWVMGAEYFESMLIDYDPCSNYGNWNYIAGVGNDPREDRVFQVESQSRKYDPNGEFTKHYLSKGI